MEEFLSYDRKSNQTDRQTDRQTEITTLEDTLKLQRLKQLIEIVLQRLSLTFTAETFE